MKRKMLKLYGVATLANGTVVLDTDVGSIHVQRRNDSESWLIRNKHDLDGYADDAPVHRAKLSDIPDECHVGLAF